MTHFSVSHHIVNNTDRLAKFRKHLIPSACNTLYFDEVSISRRVLVADRDNTLRQHYL
jgi:hypothetical protein